MSAIPTRVKDGQLWLHDGSRPLNAAELQALADMANERARKERAAQLETMAAQATDLASFVSPQWNADRQDFDWVWSDGTGAMPDNIVSYLQQQVLARRAGSIFSIGPSGG